MPRYISDVKAWSMGDVVAGPGLRLAVRCGVLGRMADYDMYLIQAPPTGCRQGPNPFPSLPTSQPIGIQPPDSQLL